MLILLNIILRMILLINIKYKLKKILILTKNLVWIDDEFLLKMPISNILTTAVNAFS